MVASDRPVRTRCLMLTALALHECPKLIKLKAIGANANHHAVMQFGTTTADAKGEAGDRLAVVIREARNGTLADALTEGGNDFDLFGEGQVVHEAHPSG